MKFLRAVLFCIATLLIYLGISLLVWGLDDLAGYFSLLPRLGYAGVVVLFSLAVGISCVFRSWIGLAASVVFLAVLLFRIRDEEQVLHQEFGAEWEAYFSSSWRLIPYIY